MISSDLRINGSLFFEYANKIREIFIITRKEKRYNCSVKSYHWADVLFCSSNFLTFSGSTLSEESSPPAQLSNLNGSFCLRPVAIGLPLTSLLSESLGKYAFVGVRNSGSLCFGFGGRYGSKFGAGCCHNVSQSIPWKKGWAFSRSTPALPPEPSRSDGFSTLLKKKSNDKYY